MSKSPHYKTEDPRISKSKILILKTTWDLLSEVGLGGLSIDEVARRSGVAKTTIYRHWPTRSDLVIDACSQIEASQRTPDQGSLRADLKVLLTDLSRMLKTANWASVLPSVIDSAERDAKIANVHGALQKQHAKPFIEVIMRAMKTGELPKKTKPSVLTAQLMGPLFYRRYFSREPLDRDFVKSLIASI